MTAKFAISHGNKFPYDAPDSWWEKGKGNPFPDADYAEKAARGILADLCDRRGIKQGFVDIDEEIRLQIVQNMAAIIRAAVEANQ